MLCRVLDPIDRLNVAQELVCHLHAHTTKVGNEMSAIRMTGNVTLCTLASILPTQGQDVATVAAPVGANVGDGLESMRDTMVDLDFVSIRLGIALADALGDDLLGALLVTSVATVLALRSDCVEKKLTTQGTSNDLVELP